MTIIVESWAAANKLTPVVGTRVIVKNNNAVVGDFSWFSMWNPFAGKYQIVRG